jgi:crotonobetainyl-CoA:carnitine CoA-transferase CaiB-like acyl-CoA transferase
MVQTVPHPVEPELRVLTSPIKIDGERAVLTAAPELGADNAALLGEHAGSAREGG